ncbi:MAG: DNA topoisomerase IB [Cyclobacteriaceae bacterium]|nr:DNA topoisomerase IB [Cyclobacteriaceae bacterium]
MVKKGISRKRKRSKALAWDYFDHKGKLITDPKIRDRCNKLVLPPAWVDVWITLDATAHLQATGKDVKGRLQYRYHETWVQQRAAEKFDGMIDFAKTLPSIRKKVEQDLALKGMPKDKVVALIVKLIDLYHFRVGNDEYAKTNKSYGLTTLTHGHMIVDRSNKAEGNHDAVFEFMGKSRKMWKRRIWEDDLVNLIVASGNVGKKSKSRDLFRYEDRNGNDFDVKSNHINEYLDAITADFGKVTAKDFRTWAATCKAAHRLSEQLDPDTKTGRKRVSNAVVKTVAEDLGNTPTVCRSLYSSHHSIGLDGRQFSTEMEQSQSDPQVERSHKGRDHDPALSDEIVSTENCSTTST